MTSEEALKSLGVSADLLTNDERSRLDAQGSLRLGQVLEPEEVAAMRDLLDELAETEGEKAGSELHQEDGAIRLANLLDKGSIFEKCLVTPRVLAGVSHVLGTSIQLSSLSSRAPLPGQGQQGLHNDWPVEDDSREYQVCNAAWLLDDCGEENGGTRFVPASHLLWQNPQDVLEDPEADHPDQVNMTGKAGDVVIFNSHLWHGGALNNSDRQRHIVLSYFTRVGSAYIQNDHKTLLRDSTKARMSKEALALASAMEE
ncbi:MAG: phytanoyl-CoA dioxygenase family protein [Planctomycetota bacterium]|nr:phytanoyl-CoA dioxygenase family protein [Planctomycetota bacterium]